MQILQEVRGFCQGPGPGRLAPRASESGPLAVGQEPAHQKVGARPSAPRQPTNSSNSPRAEAYSFSASLAFLASSTIFCWTWEGTSSYWKNSMLKEPRPAVMDFRVEA